MNTTVPLRVHYDSQIFAAQGFGGISRYFASLTLAMQDIPDVRARIVAPLHINAYLATLPDACVWGRRQPSAWPKPAVRIASLLACAAMQAARPSDILHRTYYYPFCHLPGRARNVLTVYDMIHEKYPQHFSPRDPIARWKAQAIAQADRIICISEHTRQDLLELNTTVKPERVTVTHLGFDPMDHLLPATPAAEFRAMAMGTDRPYMLFVGSRGGHKNFAGLLQAYAASPRLRSAVGLLCFGGGPFNPQENASIVQAGLASQVRQLGGPDATLAACYRHATLFVYPSLYEGFGIPPLEAMSLGCPVACSRSSSIPEVVGDAAALFEPTSIDDMQHTLEAVLDAPSHAAQLVDRGRRRAGQFSWQRCAEATATIYRETVRT